MVTRQVGEHGNIDMGAVQTSFFDADRAGLERAGAGAGRFEIGQRARQRCRFRRGEAGIDQRAGAADAERADDAAIARVQLRDPLADAGLAVGAGDGDQRHALAAAAAGGVSERPGHCPQAIHRQVGNGEFGRPDEAVAGLPDDGNGAARQRIADVGATIGEIARIGEEDVAGANAPAVFGGASGDDALRGEQRQRGIGVAGKDGGRNDGNAHNDSLAAGALATTCSGASGGTPRVRRAPPITAAKTGPATSPP